LMTLKYIWRSFSLGCHFHVHFSYPWHAFASHGLPAIAELLVLFRGSHNTVGSVRWDWILFWWLANYFPLVLWCCWLGLLTCKSVSRITYIVLVETLNPALFYPRPFTAGVSSWTRWHCRHSRWVTVLISIIDWRCVSRSSMYALVVNICLRLCSASGWMCFSCAEPDNVTYMYDSTKICNLCIVYGMPTCTLQTAVSNTLTSKVS